MILVRKIEIDRVVPDDFYPIYEYNQNSLVARDLSEPTKEIRIKKEIVNGRRFTNTLGITVVIGWSDMVETALGLPFEVFETQEKRRESDYIENYKLRKEINELKTMTLWQFIKKLWE